MAVSTQPTATISRAEAAGSAVTTVLGIRSRRSAREASTTARPSAVKRRRQSQAEGDDQQHPERDLTLGDRPEQDDQRRRAGDQAGRGPHRQQAAHPGLLRQVAVGMVAVVAAVDRDRRHVRRGSRWSVVVRLIVER